MKIIVTGAAGFIGSHLSKKLNEVGHEILAIDNLSPYYSPQLKELRVNEILKPNSINFQQIDLTNHESFENLVRQFQPNTVIHLAAQPGVRLEAKSWNAYNDSNLTAFANVYQSVVVNRVNNFLFASSSSVYGNSSEFPLNEQNNNIDPVSYYGATKLANEILVKSSISGTQTRARALRFFTVYGPYGRPDMAYFKLINSALNGIEFTLNGDGTIRRDFTYIDDVTQSINGLIKELKNSPFGFYDRVNIGGGSPKSMDELIHSIEIATNSKIKINRVKQIPYDVKMTDASTIYQIKLIGQTPNTSLDWGVKETVRWGFKNKEHLSTWINSL